MTEQTEGAEALIDEVNRALDPNGYGWAAGDGPGIEGVVRAVLASDWLAADRAAERVRGAQAVLAAVEKVCSSPFDDIAAIAESGGMEWEQMTDESDAPDWTEIQRSYLPGCANRHRHADGRYCTQVYVNSASEWHFENDDADSGMARCERRHKFDTRVTSPAVTEAN